MPTDPAPEFDLGPLSWVQGEIDQSLARGIDSLATFKAAPGDTTPLKHARQHIHQAAGAIQMVGLDAVVAFTDEVERQLTRIEELPVEDSGQAIDNVDRACRKLRIFLDELVNGAPAVPLKLYPEYETMQVARGIRATAPTDLFYPDLSPRAPKIAPREAIPASRLPSYLVKQRRAYQRGLLAWLRADEGGARTMREAVTGIEDATTTSGLRSFWWTVGALLEALTERGLEPGFGVKQLSARIDLQIRRVVEGSGKVADRLRREVLYYVAISAPVAPQVQAVQRAFHLSGLIPSAEVLNADLVMIQPLLREAREQLAGAKDSWLKYASGRAENLPKLKATLTSVHTKAAQIRNGALLQLTSALVQRLDQLPASGVTEAVALEYATALLLAESAFENYSNLAGDFPRQVEAMLARLDAARAGRGGPALAVPMLDEMSKRAQERVLLAQVGREIQANLRHMEQVLDAFFRDHSKRADLASLARDSQQIRGALTMLGLHDAERLLASCQLQIDTYATSDAPVSNDELEMLAESLSGLGFYVEAVEQQRPDRERLIAPLLARQQGTAQPVVPDDRGESTEAAVAQLRTKLPQLVEEMHRAPADAAANAALKQRLEGLRDDAELIGDDELVAQVQAALAELDAGGSAALARAVDAIAETGAAPAPEISAETQRLLKTDASALDAELLEIYLTEAGEVLDTIGDNYRGLVDNPGDREALSTVRRGFHTLKGSGRMVGLADLGEIAFGIEKLHNRLVEEERPVTPAVLALIDVAQSSFRGWVDALTRAGRVVPDTTALDAALRVVEAELPAAPGQAMAVSEPPSAPPAAPGLDLAPSQPATPEVPPPPAPPPLPEAADLPELGMDTTYTPQVDTLEVDGDIEVPSTSAPIATLAWDSATAHETPVLKLVADNRHPLPAIEIDVPPLAAGDYANDEIVVGGVTLSASLYKILCDEADQHVATLSQELALLQFDPQQLPSQSMIRASHTLCGIHRTGGFPLVAGAAKALEQALLALSDRAAPLPSQALPVLARAVAGLADLVARVKAPAAFDAGDEREATAIGAELEMLRQDGVTGSADEDAESLAAAIARRDEEPAPPVAAAAAPTLAAPPVVTVAATPEAGLPEVQDASLEGIRDEVEPDVLPIFLDEAAELFPQAGEHVRAWRRAPADPAPVRELRRTLHTFKGSARMAGAMRLGELAHQMESRLSAGDAPAGVGAALFDALDIDLDRIAYLLDRLRAGETNAPLPWVAAEAPEAPEPAPAVTSPVVVPLLAPSAPVPVSAAPMPASATAALPADGARAELEPEAGARAMLRVRADTVDRLVNEAGEVAITRARVEGELRALKSNLLELTNSVIRLRSQVREIEIQAESQIQSRMSAVQEADEGFDPLEFDRYTRFQELTRSLAEGVNDVSTVQLALLKNLDDADAALLAQARLQREVQQQLFAIRTVPFGSVSERLYRILRGTARELDKRANLEIHGAQVELDRSVLEKLVGPLEHLLRNALDHGLEPRAARVAAGKSETGEISLTVRQVGNEVVIVLVDDGGGIDLGRVRERAVSQGILTADATPTDAQIIECIFKPGFSTASKVTQISGRGIGMDVVRAEITTLGGRVDVTTRAGQGSTFTLFLPLTLAVAQAVLVRAGGRLWALPSPMVEQVQQVKAEPLVSLYVNRRVEWQGREYPFHYLPRLLGDAAHSPPTKRYNSVLLLKFGQSYAAIHVDEMIGNQEIVVKNIGPQLARVSGISGATVLGTGEIVLIINPVQLAQRTDVPAFDPNAAERVAPKLASGAAGQPQAAIAPPLVMIVDDSLTVRKITSRLLQRSGFEVITAKDGVDALQLLGDQSPDVILLDIEMPRMDGFEFTKTIKADRRHAHIPIIMITSRTAEKHRNRAQELGVDLYLGKPYQEEELLRNLREMTGIAASM